MQRLAGSMVLCLVFVGTAFAQAADPFTGSWKVDLAKSSGEGLSAAELWIEYHSVGGR